jgi:hypothetical protein
MQLIFRYVYGPDKTQSISSLYLADSSRQVVHSVAKLDIQRRICCIARFTLDAACEFLLGTWVDSLDSPLPFPYNVPAQPTAMDTPSTRFARAFAAAQVRFISLVELGPMWPLDEIFQDKMKPYMTEIRSFIDPIERSALNKKRELGQDGSKESTLLGQLLDDVTDGRCPKSMSYVLLMAIR